MERQRTYLLNITSGNRITIPKDVRDELGINDSERKVVFVVNPETGEIFLRKFNNKMESDGVEK